MVKVKRRFFTRVYERAKTKIHRVLDKNFNEDTAVKKIRIPIHFCCLLFLTLMNQCYPRLV